MARRQWEFELDGKRHVVELNHGYFLGKRRLKIDGTTIVQRGRPFSDHSGDYPFRVGGHAAVLRITTNGFTYTYDVLVGGRSVTPGSRPTRPLGGPRGRLVLGLLFLAFGIAVLPLIGPYVASEYRLATEGIGTVGTVVGSSTGTGRYGRTTYYLDYEFTVPGDGRTFLGRDDVSESTYRRASPGDRYRVTYVPSDPTISALSQGDLLELVLPAVGAIFEALWLGLGIVLTVRGLSTLRIRRSLVARGVPVDAKVVRHRDSHIQGIGRVVALEYSYRDDAGSDRHGTTQNLFPDEAEQHSIGSRLPVLFDPRSPGDSAWTDEVDRS